MASYIYSRDDHQLTRTTPPRAHSDAVTIFSNVLCYAPLVWKEASCADWRAQRCHGLYLVPILHSHVLAVKRRGDKTSCPTKTDN